mgnify:CR=1 FL=1|jgi:hypothetical protein
MASINRDNYKALMIAFSEGQLSEWESDELLAFLENNADLLDDYLFRERSKLPTLHRNSIVFEGKETLRKTVFENEYFDEFSWLCVARLEGDASLSELTYLKKVCGARPALSADLALFEKVKLNPSAETYPNKRSLKHYEFFGITGIRWYYAAASVAALMLLFAVPVWNVFQPQMETAQVSTANGKKLVYINSSKSTPPPIQRGIAISNKVASTYKVSVVAMVTDGKNIVQPIKLNNKPPVGEKNAEELALLSPILARVDIRVQQVSASDPVVMNKKLVDTNEARSDYQTVSEFLSQKISAVAGVDQQDGVKQNSKARIWEYAQAGISGLAKVFGFPVKVDRTYDPNGNLRKITIDTKLLAISKTL